MLPTLNSYVHAVGWLGGQVEIRAVWEPGLWLESCISGECLTGQSLQTPPSSVLVLVAQGTEPVGYMNGQIGHIHLPVLCLGVCRNDSGEPSIFGQAADRRAVLVSLCPCWYGSTHSVCSPLLT